LVQVRAQTADLALAIRTAQTLPYVDARRVAAVGHSFGARSAFLLSLEEPLVALVSLDGGIANRLGREWLDGVPIDRARWRTPLLHIFQEGDPIVQPDFTLIRSLRAATRTLVRVDSLPHAGFATLGFVAGTIRGFQIGTTASDLAGRASTVAAVTLNFLDSVVKGRDAALLDVLGRQYLHTVDPDSRR
jgi:dienelactone hydrolase